MRRLFWLVWILVALTGPSPAQNSVQVSSVRAEARGSMVRPIHVFVTLKYTGSEPLEAGAVGLVVVLEPDLPKPQQDQDPPLADMASPTTLEQDVGALKAGQSVTVDVLTSYKAASDFSSSGSVSGGKGRGSFRVSGVMPNEPRGSNTLVRYTVTLR